MKVQDIMTESPTCCVPADTAMRAADIMRDQDTGIVPVVDDERRLVGVITDRDLCLTIIPDARDPSQVTLEECMTDRVVSCHPDDEIDRVLDLMRDNLIRRVPVVDQEQRLEGIVSFSDLIRRDGTSAEQTHDTLREISQPTPEASKPRAESKSTYR